MATDRNPITWTSAQLIADVRRKASLPTTSTDWSDAVLMREATDVLWSFAGWALAQAGEGRMLSSLDRPVTSALPGAYGAREFLIPPLAIASTIDMVTWTDASGQNQGRLSRIDHAQEGQWSGAIETGSPTMYALIGDRIRVYPIPSTGGTLRVTYQRRHGELVPDAVANVGTVASVALTTTTTSTLTETSGITGLFTGDTIDVIRNNHPHAPIVAGAEVTSLPSGTTITVDQPITAFTGNEIAGSRVVRAGQTPYVSLPLELRACVTEKVAANVLRVMGDMQGMQAAEQNATVELARVMMLLSPRAKRDKPYAINPNSHLRTRMARGRW